MKKTILASFMAGIASWVQADTILPISVPSSINGPNAYIVQTAMTLDTSVLYTGAVIKFTGVTLTQTGPPNTLFYDLLNGNYSAKTIGNTGESSDYFRTKSPYDKDMDILGSEQFSAPTPIKKKGKIIGYNYDTETWSTDLSGTALTDLLTDVNDYGFFDLGLDPNCTYTFGSVSIDFTTQSIPPPSVPDQGATVAFLGVAFLGLLAFRRKLCVN